MDATAIIMLVFVLANLVFGILGAIVARRKGYTFFSNICALFALFGVVLGLIGIAAFFLPDLSPDAATAINDKCPKCNGDKGYVVGYPIFNRKTGEEIISPILLSIGFLVLGSFIYSLYVFGAASLLTIIVPIAFLFTTTFKSLREYFSEDKTHGVKYKCANCQQQWIRAVDGYVQSATTDVITKPRNKKMTNSEKKKRGGFYLALAAVCVFINATLPQITPWTTKGVLTAISLISTLAILCVLVFFIGGLYYLIAGFTEKE